MPNSTIFRSCLSPLFYRRNSPLLFPPPISPSSTYSVFSLSLFLPPSSSKPFTLLPRSRVSEQAIHVIFDYGRSCDYDLLHEKVVTVPFPCLCAYVGPDSQWAADAQALIALNLFISIIWTCDHKTSWSTIISTLLPS